MVRIHANRRLVAILVLLAAGAIVNDMFIAGPWLGRTAREVSRLQQQIEQRKQRCDLYGPALVEAESLCMDLRNRTGPYLSTPEDPFGWATRQVTLLATQSGLQIDEVFEVTSPRIPARRDETHRIFEPFRVHADLRGNFPEIVGFVEDLQDRNPYVTIAELSVGPRRPEDSLRRVTLVLEWPRWSDRDVMHVVLAAP